MEIYRATSAHQQSCVKSFWACPSSLKRNLHFVASQPQSFLPRLNNVLKSSRKSSFTIHSLQRCSVHDCHQTHQKNEVTSTTIYQRVFELFNFSPCYLKKLKVRGFSPNFPMHRRPGSRLDQRDRKSLDVLNVNLKACNNVMPRVGMLVMTKMTRKGKMRMKSSPKTVSTETFK